MASIDNIFRCCCWLFLSGPGYALRTRHLQPRRGKQTPWLPLASYLDDRQLLESRELEDGVLRFEPSGAAAAATAAAAAAAGGGGDSTDTVGATPAARL
eukprot:SAG22_NODE_16_length_32723_cov_26.404825_5_plen_99_part_00